MGINLGMGWNFSTNTRTKARVYKDFSNCEHVYGDWYRLKLPNPRIQCFFKKSDYMALKNRGDRLPTKEIHLPSNS